MLGRQRRGAEGRTPPRNRLPRRLGAEDRGPRVDPHSGGRRRSLGAMAAFSVVAGPFGAPPWHHGWSSWGAASHLFGLLLVPAVLTACALAVAVGRAAAAGLHRRYAPSHRVAPSAVTPARPLLASDADREQAVRVVTDAVGEARLSLDEGTGRIDQIFAVRHRDELARLVSDLPTAPPPLPRKRGHLGAVALIALAALAAVVQALFGLWELWPVAVAVSLLSTLGRR